MRFVWLKLFIRPCLGGFSNVMCGICDMGNGTVPTHYRDFNPSPRDLVLIAVLQA